MQVVHEPVHNSATEARFVAATDELRNACAWVAGRSAMVRIVPEQITAYAQKLTGEPAPAPARAPATPAQRETEAAF